MSFWNPDNIRAVAGGVWLSRGQMSRAGGDSLTGICTDSRGLRTGEVFVALKGLRTDGHEYVEHALQAGAGMVLVGEGYTMPAVGTSGAWVARVDDTGAALLRLATAYRRTLEGTRVIAVGGSNGKTTTCRLLSAVLSRTLKGSASPKSFNNAVGVPLTILRAARGDQYLICEVGTNAPGEIATLARVVEPDIAVITSVGREHLEGLGDIEGVVREEVSLLSTLRPGGMAVVNADSALLVEAATSLLTASARAGASGAKKSLLVTFGTDERANLRIVKATQDETGVGFTLNDRSAYRIGLLGLHNASNAAAAVAVARRLGIASEEIERGLLEARGPEMRMQRVDVGGVTFINDAYNANPESAVAAIRTFAEVYGTPAGQAARGTGGESTGERRGGPACGRRVLVLGDMLELGDDAPRLHREIGEAAAAAKVFDAVVLVGRLALHASGPFQRELGPTAIMPFEDCEAGRAAEIAALLAPGDRVLLKGSRRMALERIVSELATLAGGAAGAHGPEIEPRDTLWTRPTNPLPPTTTA
jgi:UDP-N-acetylmuramoyl-tripeptide--D-alanyl-D-alanine ligase